MVLRAFIFAVLCGVLHAEEAPTVLQTSEDFDKLARDLRTKTLRALQPAIVTPTIPHAIVNDRHPWHANIVTVLFCVGERGAKSSAWDANWAENFGGYDNPDPAARRDFMPVSFVPKLNPFYVALPYNDVVGGHHKPEAHSVIPWFQQAFERDGESICHDHWLAIRKGNRVCYAQWSDVGPHRSDHWEYVFGSESPKPNANHGAGLSVSPAVRDYLSAGSSDVTDWKFVDPRDVPPGPWARLGSNNSVAQRLQRSAQPVAEKIQETH